MQSERETKGQSEALERVVTQFDYFLDQRFEGHETAYTSSWTLRETYYYVCLLQQFKWAFEQGENRFSLRIYAKLSALMRTKSRLQIKKHHETLGKGNTSIDAIIHKELEVIHNSIGSNERALRKLREIEAEVSALNIVKKGESMTEKWQKRKQKRQEKLQLMFNPKQYEEFQAMVGVKEEEEEGMRAITKAPKGQMTYSCWNYYQDYIYYTYLRKNLSKFIDNKVPKKWFFYNYVSHLVKTKSRHQVFRHHFELLRLCGSISHLISYLSHNVLRYVRRKPEQIKQFKMLEQYVDEFLIKEENIASFSLEQQRKYMASPPLYEKMLARKQLEHQVKQEDDGTAGIQQFESSDSEEKQNGEQEERELADRKEKERSHRAEMKLKRKLDRQVACWEKELQSIKCRHGEVKIQQDY